MIEEIYNYAFKDLSDPRTYDWPLIAHPWGLLTIISIYLILIRGILPRFMISRDAFDLKTIIALYNIFQIIACIALIYGMIEATSVAAFAPFGCLKMDQSHSVNALRVARLFWWTFILKLIELIETCFFILRKKFNQVSTLHVYHHISTFLFSWVAVKYYPGDRLAFYVIINSAVHVIMYSYYLLSAMGPNFQKRLQPWKARLTLIQMIQFVIVVVYTLPNLHPSCPSSTRNIVYSFLIYIALMFCMFFGFYRRSYSRDESVHRVKKS